MMHSAYKPHDRVQISFKGQKSLTKQAMAADCDINTIMARYEKTGLLEHVKEVQGAYGDFSKIQDYQTSLNQVIATRQMFDTLPAKIRSKFGNNPGIFLDFCEDPNNLDEMVELGLLKKPAIEPEEAPKVAHAAVKKDAPKGAPGDPKDPEEQ